MIVVGPWQTPVADVAVTITALNMGDNLKTGEAFAMGEKPTLALISPAASARMAVAESLMNLAAADLLGELSRVRLSGESSFYQSFGSQMGPKSYLESSRTHLSSL